MNYKLIKLDIHGNENGRLISFEKDKNVPFDVKRAFYIFDTKNEIIRGCHANMESEFLLVAISGSCKVKIYDGKNTEVVLLNNPYTGLYLNKMIWKEMFEFSHNAILLVLTNTLYDETEYIRNLSDYEKFVSGGGILTNVPKFNEGLNRYKILADFNIKNSVRIKAA